MRPSYTQPPPNLPPRSSNVQSYGQGQVSDWTSNDWAPDNRNPPAAAYGGVYQGGGAVDPNSWQPQPPVQGYPPGSYGPPPVPAEAPYLQPANNWYYDAANAPPGYTNNPYGR